MGDLLVSVADKCKKAPHKKRQYRTLTRNFKIRIVFRLLEYSQGFWSYIPTHEWLFYAFDAVPVLIAMTLFLLIHPGRILIGEESEFSKLGLEEGERRWYHFGIGSRRQTDPDVELAGSESAQRIYVHN